MQSTPHRSEPAVQQWMLEKRGRACYEALGKADNHALGRSRGGLTTKLHLACTMSGLPLAAVVSAGQSHESSFIAAVIDAITVRQERGRPRKRPVRVVCDRRYSYRPVKEHLRRRGIAWVIPTASNQKPSRSFDRAAYRNRNIIERVIGWLKEYRQIGSRYEKLAIMYHTMFLLAFISEYLDHYLSDTA